MATTRCWITGVEIRREDAWALDRERAVSLRQELAGRLAVLDQVLEQLGPFAGQGPRALQLGAKPHFRRLVTGFVAQGWMSMFGDPDLFALQHDMTERTVARFREEAERHPWLGTRARACTAEAWPDLRNAAAAARQGVASRDAQRMRRVGLDLALALAQPEAERTQLASWLRSQDPEALVAALSPPARDRAECLELLEIRLKSLESPTGGARPATSDDPPELRTGDARRTVPSHALAGEQELAAPDLDQPADADSGDEAEEAQP